MEINAEEKGGAEILDMARLADMAQLCLTPEELQLYKAQLTSALQQAACLQDMEVDNIEPLAQTATNPAKTRADLPLPGLARDCALANAPLENGEYFVVPKMV